MQIQGVSTMCTSMVLCICDEMSLACEQGEGRGGEGRERGREERRKRGACRNTSIFRLKELYNLCGTVN